ncbi:MAG: hypothetical protein O2960_06180 [Verrucomicrobia bacterium]|nr:hypothetical protein [Verrucomicrobiota bacterium]
MEALSGQAKTVALERHYIDKDYRDTFSNFHSKRFSTPDSRCVRLHFFSRAVARVELKDAVKVQADYLGYAVIRPTRPNCLGRTLLKPESRNAVSGSMRLCDETITLQGTNDESKFEFKDIESFVAPKGAKISFAKLADLPTLPQQFNGHPTMKEPLEVIPGQAELSQPLFKSEREYQEFRRSYSEEITTELEDLREARRQSEEQSKQHWMC